MSTGQMIEGRRADSTRRRRRVLNAIHDATAAGEEISVSAIARRAGVDRTFFYRHRDLLAQVHAAGSQPINAGSTGPAVSRASLLADLANAQERGVRLATRIRLLEQRLSEVLGEQAWRESGLGAPDDVNQLNKRVVHLEQQVADLQLQLDERTDELAAARATNRQLMTSLNTAPAPESRR